MRAREDFIPQQKCSSNTNSLYILSSSISAMALKRKFTFDEDLHHVSEQRTFFPYRDLRSRPPAPNDGLQAESSSELLAGPSWALPFDHPQNMNENLTQRDLQR